MDVGQKIRDYLSATHISQTWLSDHTKIPLPKLNLSLTGKRRLTFAEYEVICGVLGVGVDRFIEPRMPT